MTRRSLIRMMGAAVAGVSAGVAAAKTAARKKLWLSIVVDVSDALYWKTMGGAFPPRSWMVRELGLPGNKIYTKTKRIVERSEAGGPGGSVKISETVSLTWQGETRRTGFRYYAGHRSLRWLPARNVTYLWVSDFMNKPSLLRVK